MRCTLYYTVLYTHKFFFTHPSISQKCEKSQIAMQNTKMNQKQQQQHPKHRNNYKYKI